MNKKLKNLLLVVIVPTLYAILLRLLFGIQELEEILGVMTITFLFCLPTILGILTVYFSDIEKVEKLSYRLFMPWVPIILFLVVTLFLAIEGWACWIMILPVFFVAASIGGLIGGYLKLKKPNDKLNLSFFVLLPFLLAPLENLIQSIPATYQAHTYIDIKADPDNIWDNVTKVAEIKEVEDSGWLNRFLGFPRPVKAELNFEGVGAYRKAIFTNGLVFHETVTAYRDNEFMAFNIKAFPHEIPSTTLDEHVVIGGNFFDVLEGRYEIENLGQGVYRLHLSSTFEMKTTFNFYAGWWGKWIMTDIQNNILRVQKKRSENTFTTN